MKKFILVLTGLAALVSAILFFVIDDKNGINYNTAMVDRGDITVVCTASGTVNPLKTVLVGTQVSGRIQTIEVDYNDIVTEGQIVATIDPAPFEAQLEQARANLLSAQANLTKSEASLLEAERNYNRQKQLFAEGVVGENVFENAETNLEVAKSQVLYAKAQVVQAEAAKRLAETNLKYTVIYSPVDGVVISRKVDVGQTVAAAFQTPTLFTVAKDLKKMQINTDVDEADIGKVGEGQKVTFTVDAYPYDVFEGVVKQVRISPTVIQNVVTYDVVVSFDNFDLKLKPGMTANVSIVVAEKKNVLRIPNAAFRFVPKDADIEDVWGQDKSVWVLSDGQKQRINVETGVDDYSYTEFLSGDLREGDLLITGYMETGKRLN